MNKLKQDFVPFDESLAKTPIIKTVDAKYWVSATRDQFAIYFYQWGKNQKARANLKKSRFGGGRGGPAEEMDEMGL